MHDQLQRESLFDAWDQEHRGILLKVARSFARSAVDCDELVQEMRLQLWKSTKTYQGSAKASTWIYRVCLNAAITWQRGRMRLADRVAEAIDVKELVAHGASPAESTEDRDMLERLYACVRKMPEFDRALTVLALDGVPYGEIAEITGLTQSHVGVALLRARRRLTKLMRGVADELE